MACAGAGEGACEVDFRAPVGGATGVVATLLGLEGGEGVRRIADGCGGVRDVVPEEADVLVGGVGAGGGVRFRAVGGAEGVGLAGEDEDAVVCGVGGCEEGEDDEHPEHRA